jgi:MYXO-CTERM domain-containing protein
MNRLMVAGLLLLPLAAGAYTTGTVAGGVTTAVNAGPGAQTDPHVDGNLVAYTSQIAGGLEIRYFDFSTGTDAAIPTSALKMDFLADVSGGVIVFTRGPLELSSSSIWAFDTSTAGPAYELAPLPGCSRRNPAIGGTTVAWQDLSDSTSTVVRSEIVAYDLLSGVSQQLTDDLQFDANPAVSPDGNVIVWEKCATSVSPCDIWQAARTGGAWGPPVQATSTSDGEAHPATDGALVAYGVNPAGGATGPDIAWRPVAGGAEIVLALPGEQQRPTTSGDVVVFEGRSMTDPTPNWDLYLYDLQTSTLYRLTDTPLLDETLSDVSVSGTQARVVWSVIEVGDINVYGLTFQLAGRASCTGPGCCHHDDEDDDHLGGDGHHHDGEGDDHHDACQDRESDHHGRHRQHKGDHQRRHETVAVGLGAASRSAVATSTSAPASGSGCSSAGGGSTLVGLLAVAGLLHRGRRRVAPG